MMTKAWTVKTHTLSSIKAQLLDRRLIEQFIAKVVQLHVARLQLGHRRVIQTSVRCSVIRQVTRVRPTAPSE
jgi:hypothetical protein